MSIVPALPEGIRNENMKFTQRLGAYYAKQKYFSYFSGPGTSNCSGWNMWDSPGVSGQS